MKIFALLFTIMTFNFVYADEAVSHVKVDVLQNPVVASSLANACDIVRLINDLKWDDVTRKLNKGNQVGIVVMKAQSKMKDWPGTGAHRGSELNTKNHTVKHRFSFGSGRNTEHEVWITYSYSKDRFEKPSVDVLGW